MDQGSERRLANLKSELVRALQLTSVVIGCSIGLIPISQILNANQALSQQGSFIGMFLFYVSIFLACRCRDIAKPLSDRKPRDIYF